MTNLFNLITAWASVVLLFLVVIIWILRILVQKKIVAKDSFLYTANRTLRKYHKWIGVSFLVIAFIHGLLSSAKLFSFNWGSLSFFFILIMSLSYLVKKRFERKTWVNMHRVLTVLVVLTLIIHLFDVGISGLGLLRVPAADLTQEYELSEGEVSDIQDDIDETQQSATDGSATYQDGVYTGVADGYGPDLTVEITIQNNLITNVVVVSHNEEKEQFWGTPVEEIPLAIVEAQSVEVDSVSGATYTSVGIKNAVLDALTQAIVDGDLPEEQDTPTGGQHGRGH